MTQWSPQQETALKAVSDWLRARATGQAPQIFRVFGFAGTGKTTLARHLAAGVDGNVLFGAFTGKAALVLRNKGCPNATTIHSMIYTVQEGYGGVPEFVISPTSPAHEASLIIIDECSMVDDDLGRDLLSFGKPVLVLGDPAQLPPVRGEGFFTNHEPDIMLTEIHRQALDNPIIALSQKVREGGAIERGDYGAVRVVSRSGLATEDVLDADQVLVGKNITRRNFNKWFRRILERPDPVNPVPGDKLVCLRNKHDKGLLNGGLWEVVELKEKANRRRKKSVDLFAGGLRQMIVRPLDEGVGDCGVEITVPSAFFLGSEHELDWKERRRYDEFDFGYALTVHKSQGSQWDNVMVFDESAVFREDRNRHLYTAITRAAERLTIVQS